MGFQVSRQDIDRVVNCMPEAIERVLRLVQLKVESTQITDYKNRTPQRSVTEETPQRRPSPRRDAGGFSNPTMGSNFSASDSQALAEKEQIIHELKETIEIMELKIKKLEQLVSLKDGKIQTLTNKLTAAGLMP